MTFQTQIEAAATREAQCRAALVRPWHQSDTVKRILGEMAADGFPSHVIVTVKGIWEDREEREYDRYDRWVRALMAARDMALELANDAGLVGSVDALGADRVIEHYQARTQWQAAFLDAIEAMELDHPPYGSDAAEAARSGDVDTDPVEAAQAFVARCEADRLERVRQWHAARKSVA